MEEISEHETPQERQERIKFRVSRFIEDKLIQAVRLRWEAVQSGNDIDIVQCLQNVWPEDDGAAWQRKPRFTVSHLDEVFSVRFEGESNEYDSAARLMTIAVGNLRRATTLEESEGVLLGVIEAVYHEAEHIYNPGSGLEPVDIPETIEYLGNPGEIEAHGRQFAYRYRREFPGEPFDVQKMAKLSEKIKNSGKGNRYYNYFVAFADPIKQQSYKDFGDVQCIYEKIVEATKRHLQILSAHAEEK